MSAFETTVPTKKAPSRVAWVGTRHHTLQGSAPFRMIVEPTLVVRAEGKEKM
jgi:hypothetical protein